ncbi:hypothetical protein CERSUDRAFT_154240 [Gelatoporia subvermispora B]|uniref:Uncharacterized protein n=1 Tax=Ceriporiopsis subvermispora (strain B) TaxID=914234 RepID=M2QZD4_CERS8|nr:hypothetical protein CERSUDRAFT_154240 [Gelatoporia subvermispora B]
MSEQRSVQESNVRGPVRLPEATVVVTDADEEIFLLYTDLSRKASAESSTSFRGLGHLDSHKDTLTLKFRLNEPSVNASVDASSRKKKSARKARRPPNKHASPEEEYLEIELAQDTTSLRSRKGDTGSVVWRASVDLAQHFLIQHHTRDPHALLDPDVLRDAHVMELGAGTGLLSVLLGPLARRYTVTDIDAIVPLIRKNIYLNSPTLMEHSPGSLQYPRSRTTLSPQDSPSIVVEPLDWTTVHNASHQSRNTYFAYPVVDLLLVVDCIYHTSLLPALITTIDHLSTPGKTAVLVVVELRAEDVVREFLDRWLGLPGGEWEIRSVPDLMEGPYGAWVGWKKATEPTT